MHLIMLMRMDGKRSPTAEGEMNEDACTAQKQESDKQINLSTECIKYPHQRRAFRGRKEEHIVLVKVEVDKADHEHNREEQAQNMVEAAQIGSMSSGQNLCQRHVDQQAVQHDCLDSLEGEQRVIVGNTCREHGTEDTTEQGSCEYKIFKDRESREDRERDKQTLQTAQMQGKQLDKARGAGQVHPDRVRELQERNEHTGRIQQTALCALGCVCSPEQQQREYQQGHQQKEYMPGIQHGKGLRVWCVAAHEEIRHNIAPDMIVF